MRGVLVAVAMLAGCAKKPRASEPPVGAPGKPLPEVSRPDAGPTLAALSPEQHRPAAAACGPHPGPLVSSSASGCQRDADCKGPGTPHCVEDKGFHRVTNRCVVDNCQADADCAGGAVCQCGGSHSVGNHCVTGNCRIDADCGPHGACSPSVSISPQGACGDPPADVVGYFCRTPIDTCRGVSDCTGGTTCTFVSALGRWQCMANLQCPDG